MKRIVSLLVALLLVVTALVACNKTPVETTPENNAPVEKTYTVAIAVDSAINASNNKVSNTALVLVLDDAGKIVAARFDAAEVTPTLEEGAVVAVPSVQTKVEKGDAYVGMAAGSFAKQTKAFEDYIVGKTAAEVAALDLSLVAGCTMQSTKPLFQALVAEAAASTLKVTFKTADAITAGIAISTSVSNKGKVSSDFAGVVMAGGKVVATVIDSCEQSFTVADGAIVAPATAALSKNEQGEGYKMEAGSWAKQAQAFANTTVGKTVAELANLETVSDALAAAGCTMQYTTAGYKTTIIAAAGYAR